MDTLLNEEELMVKNSAREFLEAECPPALVRDMERDERGYPAELWSKVVDLGWPGLALPEEYGGSGLPITYLGIVLEEMGRALAPLPVHSTSVAALTIASAGSEQQRQDTLPAVASGDSILTWAFTEQTPRYTPDAINLEATLDGDDYVLNGTKMFVDNFVVADKCLVVARTAAESEDNEGVSLLIVDTNSPGISHIPLLTMAKDKQSEVTFENVRVPKANLIGEADRGWSIVQDMIDLATVLLCAQMVGAARMDADMAIEYAKNRTAFGRPIAAFPVHFAHVRRYDHVGGRRAASHVRGAVEAGPGAAGQGRDLAGQGFLQRKVREHRALRPDDTRRHRVHDGVRPAPVVSPRLLLDDALGHHLRAPRASCRCAAGP